MRPLFTIAVIACLLIQPRPVCRAAEDTPDPASMTLQQLWEQADAIALAEDCKLENKGKTAVLMCEILLRGDPVATTINVDNTGAHRLQEGDKGVVFLRHNDDTDTYTLIPSEQNTYDPNHEEMIDLVLNAKLAQSYKRIDAMQAELEKMYETLAGENNADPAATMRAVAEASNQIAVLEERTQRLEMEINKREHAGQHPGEK